MSTDTMVDDEKIVDRGSVIEHMMRPRSVAVLGVSTKAGSAGNTVVQNLLLNEFAGAVHAVGRGGGRVGSLEIMESADEIPFDVDLAVIALPASAVHDALKSCVRRRVKAAVIFSSGFAEAGERQLQDALVRTAQAGNVALIGPNCLGFTNSIDGLNIGFAVAQRLKIITSTRDPAVGIVSQSGGLAGHIRMALDARDIPTSYYVSTGNEAGLGLADFVDFFTSDPATKLIIAYVEEFRNPAAFLRAASRARDAGKALLLLSPGQTEGAKAAIGSHTGSMAGDYEVMRTVVTRAAVLVLDNLDELIDTAEIVARFPVLPVEGPGIITFSGAFCALAHDYCERLEMPIPHLSSATEEHLTPLLPPFIPPRNPLDLGTQPIWQPELLGSCPKALLNEPSIGSLLISCPVVLEKQSVEWISQLVESTAGSRKPIVFAPLGDRSQLPARFVEIARENRVIVSRSSDRSLRAIANVTRFARLTSRMSRSDANAGAEDGKARFADGPQPEWLGKKFLSERGVRIPDGGLATTVDEAVVIASTVGFPVAAKVQAALLTHKTDAGGVTLNIVDADALRLAWASMCKSVQRHAPDVVMDGILIEAMLPKSLELIIGAKRDALWGPVLLVGLGGIWVEAIRDIRIMPVDLTVEDYISEIRTLKSSRLLDAFRGRPALDVYAIANVLRVVGECMNSRSEIQEIEVNPLFVNEAGKGVTAADVLIVAGPSIQPG